MSGTTTPSASTPVVSSFRAHSWQEWRRLITASLKAWSNDFPPSMGAALSHYSEFSMAPLLVVVISIAGLVFGAEATRGEVFGQLRGLKGYDLSASLGLAALLLGATTVFGGLQDALDRIWRAPACDRSGGLLGVVRSRLLSFGMILGIAFLLMVSLVLSAVTAALGRWWSTVFIGWELLLQGVNIVVGFALTTGVFAMIYKLMPRVIVRWRDVWLGATITAALFTVGRFFIGLYIGKSGIASGFGAAGSIARLFVGVYYSAQIFLLSAVFTGSMRQPSARCERFEQHLRPTVQPLLAATKSQSSARASLPLLSNVVKPPGDRHAPPETRSIETGAAPR